MEQFPISNEIYTENVKPYLISKETDRSYLNNEFIQKLLSVVEGTGEGYSTPVKTDLEAVKRLLEWNKNHFSVDPEFEKHIPPYKKIVSIKANEMFTTQLTRHSTSRSILLTSELRAIGLPVMSTFAISCECNPNEDSNCNNRGTHPQNLVFLGGSDGNWVLVDYNYGFKVRQDPMEYLNDDCNGERFLRDRF